MGCKAGELEREGPKVTGTGVGFDFERTEESLEGFEQRSDVMGLVLLGLTLAVTLKPSRRTWDQSQGRGWAASLGSSYS